jgi:Rieske Fe-S protein
VRVPLARLDPAGRVEIEYAGEPAEVVRTASGVVARSLLCSHFGCRVQWEAANERYRCPCHEGAFDREGRPVAGPPTRPLRALPFEVAGHDILVGAR